MNRMARANQRTAIEMAPDKTIAMISALERERRDLVAQIRRDKRTNGTRRLTQIDNQLVALNAQIVPCDRCGGKGHLTNQGYAPGYSCVCPDCQGSGKQSRRIP